MLDLVPILIVMGLAGCSGEPAGPAGVQANCASAKIAQTVFIPKGEFVMGADNAYPEEAPARPVAVEAFSLDTTEVTNNQFAAFVDATGYKTTAERVPDPGLVPDGAPERFHQAGAAVFIPPDSAGQSWWQYVPGANWRHPEGPGSNIDELGSHPVVQVSYEDAIAYADWAGRRLPSEAEWEYAARGGEPPTMYTWGDTPPSKTDPPANTWQGLFPIEDTGEDGYRGTAPAGCFSANPYGLYDMIGNVWEWTASPYDDRTNASGEASMAIKGGSFLCAPNFCVRYRPPARQGQEAGLPTNHIGFRTASDVSG